MGKNWSEFVDSYGLIVQVGAYFPGSIDRGDSLQRNGFYALAITHNQKKSSAIYVFEKYKFKRRMKKCNVGPGLYVRHPAPEGNAHTSIWKTSRDQMRSNIIAAGIFKQDGILKPILKALAGRWFKFWNIMKDGEPDWNKAPNEWSMGRKFGDISGPEDFACYIRALRWYWLYPVVAVLDVAMVLGSIVKIFVTVNNPKEYDDVSRIVLLYQAQKVMPTPLSWLARKLYKHFRPGYRVLASLDGATTYTYDSKISGPQYAMDGYFGNPWEPPFNELYRQLLKDM